MPTISIHKGKGSLTHNNRTIKNRSAEKSWNAELSKNNIVYVDNDLLKVYDNLFGESQKNYNFEQIQKGHSERCVKSYYEKIQNSKQEKTNYELIIQVGDIADKNSSNYQKIQQCLDEYNRSFQERNPNFVVFQQITHRDEKGMDHTHINFVPVSTGNHRGFEIKNSFSGALKEMGYGRNGFVKWRETEQNVLISIMREHGLEFELGSGRAEHLTIAEYQQINQIAEKKAVEQLQQMADPDINDLEYRVKQNPLTKKQSVTLEKADFDKLNEKLNTQQMHITSLEAQKRVLNDKIENRESKIAEMQKKPYRALNERLTHAKNDLTKRNNIANAKIDQLESKIADLNSKNAYLEKENQQHFSTICTLEEENNSYRSVNIQLKNDKNSIIEKYNNLAMSYNSQKTRISELENEIKSLNVDDLRRENRQLKNSLSEEKEKTRQQQTEIDDLKTSNRKLNNSIIQLIDGLKTCSQSLRFVMDYINHPFKEILSSLMSVTNNLLSRCHVDPKQLNYEIPYEVARNIELDVEYKRGDYGKGIYLADTEIMLNEFDSISEARDFYESADIENLVRSRSYDLER